MSSTSKNAIGAAVLLAGTLAALIELLRFPAEARAFPLMVLGTLLLSSSWWLVRTLMVPPTEEESVAARGNMGRLGVAVLLTVAYAAAVSHFSYFLPTAVFIPAMALALGNRQPLVVCLSGIGFAAGAYVIFVVLFERPIPLL